MNETWRLVLALILNSFAWMAVFRAPQKTLWMFAIGLTELPWLFSCVTLCLFIPPYHAGWENISALVLAAVAFLFIISPLLRAIIVAPQISSLLENAYGIRPEGKAFYFFRMFFPRRVKKTEPEIYTYLRRADGTELRFDFYRARGNACPLVIVVHGGSWAGGDSRQLASLNHHLAEAGFSVAAINYSLAPQYRYPQPVDDLDALINFLQRQSSEFCIDAQHIFLLGRSAGGQIAMMAAYRRSIPGLRGIISYYAPADMVWAGQVAKLHTIIDSTTLMRQYLGGTYEEHPELYAKSSPLETITADAPPALLFHGLRDELVYPHHAEMLSGKMKALHVPHCFIRLPWATHGFDAFLSGPSGQISRFAVLHFMQTQISTEKTKAKSQVSESPVHRN